MAKDMTLKQFSKNLKNLEQKSMDDICEKILREMTLRFLTKVIQLTPVGKSEDGYIGGTLRRGWIIRNQSLLSKFFKRKRKVSVDKPSIEEIENFVKGLKFKKVGKSYKITVVNPVHYAKYVNYGHRKRRQKGYYKNKYGRKVLKKKNIRKENFEDNDWVDGYFFLEKAEKYINRRENYNKVFKALYERELKRELGL